MGGTGTSTPFPPASCWSLLLAKPKGASAQEEQEGVGEAKGAPTSARVVRLSGRLSTCAFVPGRGTADFSSSACSEGNPTPGQQSPALVPGEDPAPAAPPARPLGAEGRGPPAAGAPGHGPAAAGGHAPWPGGSVVGRRCLSPGALQDVQVPCKNIWGGQEPWGYRWRAGGAAAYWGAQGGLLGKVALARPWRRSQTPVVVGEDLRPEEARGLGLLGEARPVGDPEQQGVPGPAACPWPRSHAGGCGHGWAGGCSL